MPEALRALGFTVHTMAEVYPRGEDERVADARWIADADRASWVAYDRAIKSQGATEGVAGYGRVIDLVLGSDILADEGLRP